MIANFHRERRARGFTLIELLTVIGIIAILATLLMSSLASAKKKARIARCTSNLRQISLALNMYLDDFPDRPPGYAPMFFADYLPNRAALICPEDRSERWGNLVLAQLGQSPEITLPVDANWAGRAPGTEIRFSYLHPARWSDAAWSRILRRGGSAGISVCQLHGLGKMDLENPSARNFEGLLLRAQMDGAVVRRHYYWEEAESPAGPPPAFTDSEMAAPPGAEDPAVEAYPFGLFIDPRPDESRADP